MFPENPELPCLQCGKPSGEHTLLRTEKTEDGRQRIVYGCPDGEEMILEKGLPNHLQKAFGPALSSFGIK